MSVHRGGAWSRVGLLLGGGCLVQGVPGPGGVCSHGGAVGIPACTEADPPGETATTADGTHPTGMHSCSKTDEAERFYFRNQ